MGSLKLQIHHRAHNDWGWYFHIEKTPKPIGITKLIRFPIF
jgi:hypothetical protein